MYENKFCKRCTGSISPDEHCGNYRQTHTGKGLESENFMDTFRKLTEEKKQTVLIFAEALVNGDMETVERMEAEARHALVGKERNT